MRDRYFFACKNISKNNQAVSSFRWTEHIYGLATIELYAVELSMARDNENN